MTQDIVFLPDLHNGHPKIDCELLYLHMISLVYPQLRKCKLLIIGGDFFHTLLDFNSPAGHVALAIINDLLDLSEECGFYIRVLQGTFTHDRQQLDRFLSNRRHTNVVLNGNLRLEVVKNIRLEEFESLNLRIGYIPDDLPNESNWDTLCKQMDDVHWDSIDILAHHGYFKHLLGAMPAHIVPKNTLDWRTIKKRVRGCVLNGHVHLPGVFENVVSGGSLERFCHGEEEDKGFFIIRWDPETHICKFEFLVNKDATLFKTLNLTRTDHVDDALQTYIHWLTSVVASVEPTRMVYVRVIVNDATIRVALERYTRENYRKVQYTAQESSDKTVPEEDPVMVIDDLPSITEGNVIERIVQHAHSQFGKFITEDDVREVLYGHATS